MSARGNGGETRVLALAAVIFAGFVPLLVVAPTLTPSDPTILSAAAAEGYNTGVAYRVAVLWALTGIVAALLAARRGMLPAAPRGATDAHDSEVPPARRWIERIVVALLVLLLLWPPFLARYGPFIEDNIFTNALHRMHGGMMPYRDFEFLYGPLMLVSASWWTRLVGYSLQGYYTWLLILEVVQYVVLVALLQRLVPEFRARVLIFVAIAILVANPLLGLNYNGIRRLLPLAALLLLSRDPTSTRRAIVAGVMLGLGVAYAHDFGLVALVASAGLFGLLWLRAPSLALFRTAALLGAVAIATWLLVTFLLLGDSFTAYLVDTRSLVTRFSAGEAGFRFYWTANSLAGFALLSLAGVLVGRGIAHWRERAPLWGDSFFVVAMMATLLSLKSGLNRSDVWHLDGALFPLALAFLLPLPRRAFAWSVKEGRVATMLLAAFVMTYALGNAPTAAYAGAGLARGAQDVLAGVPPDRDACAPARAAPCIESERSSGREEFEALGAYLAEPTQRGRRVMLYGELWGIGPRIGVYKRDHLNDDFIYDDARGIRAGQWIAEVPDGLVAIDSGWYARLVAPAGGDTIGATAPFTPSLVKSASVWLASVHYRGVVVERPLAELRWRRTAGVTVRREFVLDRRFGKFVVLRRRSSP